MGFRKAKEGDPRVNSEVQIFVENLPKTVTVPELSKFFEKAGKIKKDRDTRQPRIWLYHDKTTKEPTGECTITYYDHDSQVKALDEFNQALFQGHTITVTPSIVKFHMARVPPRRAREAARGRGRGGSRGGRGRSRGKPQSDDARFLASSRISGFGHSRGQSNDRRRSYTEAPSRVQCLSESKSRPSVGRDEDNPSHDRNLSGNSGSNRATKCPSVDMERSTRPRSDRRFQPY